MDYSTHLHLDDFHRNGYHLFVDVIDRLLQETPSTDPKTAYRMVWRYFTHYWSKLSPEQLCGLNRLLVDRVGHDCAKIGLANVQADLRLDAVAFPPSRSKMKVLADLPPNWSEYVSSRRTDVQAQNLPWRALWAAMPDVPPVALWGRGPKPTPTREQ
ncbi:uncharacterized protein JCM10292_004767 [Rhodotorula paludigena]|uniref:uncharacterized protein n=1 Tax=Rhodotorula paludigena TaxID=86838 RepID=UPI00316B1C61